MEIINKNDFEEGFSVFQLYKPVKVARELKDEFHNAINKHFLSMGIVSWGATLYPLKKYWKFKRIKIKW